MKEYSAYIFDMDLTLLDAVECSIDSYIKAFEAVGSVFDPNEIAHHLAIPLRDSYNEIKNPTNSAEVFIETFSKVSKGLFVTKTKYYEDGLMLLRKLKADGKKIGIVTNRETVNIVSSFDANPEMKKLVDEYVSCNMVKELKPSPEPLLLCLKKLNVKANEAVYIGDAKNDYLCATSADVDYIEIERMDNCNFDCPTIIHNLNEVYYK